MTKTKSIKKLWNIKPKNELKIKKNILIKINGQKLISEIFYKKTPKINIHNQIVSNQNRSQITKLKTVYY